MKLSELIAAVGDEHVIIQNLQSSFASGNCGKKDATLTFYTDKAKAQDMMKWAATEIAPRYMCMIVWMPDDLVRKAMATESPNKL